MCVCGKCLPGRFLVLPDLWWKALVELVLAGDEGLADGLLPETQHTRVAPNLVNEGLKHHPFSGIGCSICLQIRLGRALDRKSVV